MSTDDMFASQLYACINRGINERIEELRKTFLKTSEDLPPRMEEISYLRKVVDGLFYKAVMPIIQYQTVKGCDK